MNVQKELALVLTFLVLSLLTYFMSFQANDRLHTSRFLMFLEVVESDHWHGIC